MDMASQVTSSPCEVALAHQWAEAKLAYDRLASAADDYSTTSQAALLAACGVIDVLRSHADDHLGAGHSFADLTPGVRVPSFFIAPPAINTLNASGVDCSNATTAACVSAWQQEYDQGQVHYARLHSSVVEYSRDVGSAMKGASQVYSAFVDQIDVAFYDWGGFRAIFGGSGVVPPTGMDVWVQETFEDNPLTNTWRPPWSEGALATPSLGLPALPALVVEGACLLPSPHAAPPSPPPSPLASPPPLSSPPLRTPPTRHLATTSGIAAFEMNPFWRPSPPSSMCSPAGSGDDGDDGEKGGGSSVPAGALLLALALLGGYVGRCAFHCRARHRRAEGSRRPGGEPAQASRRAAKREARHEKKVQSSSLMHSKDIVYEDGEDEEVPARSPRRIMPAQPSSHRRPAAAPPVEPLLSPSL